MEVLWGDQKINERRDCEGLERVRLSVKSSRSENENNLDLNRTEYTFQNHLTSQLIKEPHNKIKVQVLIIYLLSWLGRCVFISLPFSTHYAAQAEAMKHLVSSFCLLYHLGHQVIISISMLSIQINLIKSFR